jgi:hypothetical protein
MAEMDKWVLFSQSGVSLSGVTQLPQTVFQPGAAFDVLTSGFDGNRFKVALEEQGMSAEAGRLGRTYDALLDAKHEPATPPVIGQAGHQYRLLDA